MRPHVVVLGAGINGTALARELVLLDCRTTLIDAHDLGSGTTAYSSRLIHGGLRYLEYGDTPLVRESLAERERLLRLAPDFVRPLEFRVPTTSRLGGVVDAATKLCFGKSRKSAPPRGAWLVRFGLAWYSRLAGESTLPGPRTLGLRETSRLGLNQSYRHVTTYFDAQMPFPERFVVALADDARRAAAELGVVFRLHTYAEVAVRDDVLVVTDVLGRDEPAEYRPDAVVNAGGPWADDVLRRLGVPSSRLLAGTKGTHLLTFHEGVRRTIGDAALYVEAADGRPVFILPFGAGTLVGTTDLPYEGDPADAVATEEEIDYLLGLVNHVLPQTQLTRSDVTLHYAGVRPLPHSSADVPAAVTRRHAVVERSDLPWPVFSLVGGKLTTCRQLAEEAAAAVAKRLAIPVRPVSRDRPIPELTVSTPDDGSSRPYVAETTLRRRHARQVVRREFVRRLDDLVERRLMLHFTPQLHHATLDDLAGLLVEEGLLAADARRSEVERVEDRLRRHFGRDVRRD